MLNFCIFIFILYFLKKVFRMIFPKKVKIYKEVIIAGYCDFGKNAVKRKTPQKPAVLYADDKYKKKNKRKCA